MRLENITHTSKVLYVNDRLTMQITSNEEDLLREKLTKEYNEQKIAVNNKHCVIPIGVVYMCAMIDAIRNGNIVELTKIRNEFINKI